jgi:hypothetical protein
MKCISVAHRRHRLLQNLRLFSRHLVEINYALPETLVETLQCNVSTFIFTPMSSIYYLKFASVAVWAQPHLPHSLLSTQH